MDTTVEESNIYVENIPKNWANTRLNKEFQTFGDIESTLVLHKRNGESKGKGFVNFNDKESARKAIQFFKHIQTESNERKRSESVESLKPDLVRDFMRMRVSSATRKEKPKKKIGRVRADTEPHPSQEVSTNAFPRTFHQPQQPIQLLQPVLCYMAVPVTQLPRTRSSTEPYILPQQQSSIPMQYYVEPLQPTWYPYRQTQS